jgi:murein DD-endopeptidase MepM/ murein hydrolase activator NlpD
MKYAPIILGIIILLIIAILIPNYSQIHQRITGFPGDIQANNGRTVEPVKYYFIAYSFGPRLDPITGDPAFHNGLDLATWQGMAVYAVKDGTVVKKDYAENGYGNYIMLQHSDGTYTVYGHMSEFGNISIGQNVGAGSVIGAIGSTGRSTGSHLHFELRDKNQEPIDPLPLLNTNRWTIARLFS